MTISYRKATINDCETLVKLRLIFLEESINYIAASAKAAISSQLVSYYPKHIEHDFIAYMAEINGGIAATAFLTMIERPANPALVTGKIGIISNVYTFPKYRKNGIALELMKRLIEEAKVANLSYIELAATESGKYVYEKLGFVVKQSKEYTDMKLNLL